MSCVKKHGTKFFLIFTLQSNLHCHIAHITLLLITSPQPFRLEIFWWLCDKYQLSHGSECNMANVFRVFHRFVIYFTSLYASHGRGRQIFLLITSYTKKQTMLFNRFTILGSKSFMSDFVLLSNDITFFTYILLKNSFRKLQLDDIGRTIRVKSFFSDLFVNSCLIQCIVFTEEDTFL